MAGNRRGRRARVQISSTGTTRSRDVGTINSLDYDKDGALTIRGTVTDPIARRCNAFSVGATVRDFELVNASTSEFYALIKHASLDEISLIDTPTNPRALVTSRQLCSCRVLWSRSTTYRAPCPARRADPAGVSNMTYLQINKIRKRVVVCICPCLEIGDH